MKVALLNFSSSGLFHYATGLAQGLLEHSATVEILFVTSSHNNLTLIPSEERLRIYAPTVPLSLSGILRWLSTPSAQSELRQYIQTFQPDVIHILDSLPIYFRHHRLWQQFPVVWTQHDPVLHSGDPYQLPTRLIQRYLQHISQRVIVHGQVLQQQLLQHAPYLSQKVISVPMGSFGHVMTNSDSPTEVSGNTILFFGRIAPYKGLDVLLDSLIQLQAAGVTFTLHIAGPGNLQPYEPLLRQILNKTITNQYVPETKLAQLFAQATVVVAPYYSATQSAVVNLALAAGRPIIASHVGAIPELITDGYNGLLVPPNNPTILAEKIQTVLGNPTLQQQLGQSARQNQLPWSQSAAQHWQVYRSLV